MTYDILWEGVGTYSIDIHFICPLHECQWDRNKQSWDRAWILPCWI
uniref:Uncharacterized protein n=1 Tax=Picea glauca TaxID=3330 RepID=A0A101LX44_PICGL|nr:hypothetical protein ABT39_MTgene6405 [Picea glauca]